MSIEGIDVSVHNGSIDWPLVRNAGKRFAVIKVNEGDVLDKTATKQRVAAITKAGIIPGGYAYVHPRAGRTGAKEFGIFYAHAKKIGLLHDGNMQHTQPPILAVIEGDWRPVTGVEVVEEIVAVIDRGLPHLSRDDRHRPALARMRTALAVLPRLEGLQQHR